MRNEKCTREGVIMYRYMWDGSAGIVGMSVKEMEDFKDGR